VADDLDAATKILLAGAAIFLTFLPKNMLLIAIAYARNA
jgi:hypothetical protein